MAAANITKTDIATFTPEIIAALCLKKMVGDQVFPRLAYTDVSPDLKKHGETVMVPGIGEFVAKDKAVNTPVVKQDMVSTEVPVTLDKHKYVDFILEDSAIANASQNLMERFGNAAARGLLKQIEQDFADLFDNAYVTGVGTITATSGAAAVVGVGTTFTDLKVGDKFKTAGGVIREITVITDDLNLTVDSNWSATESAVAFSYMQQSVYANAASIDDAAILNARMRLREQNVDVDNLVLVSNLTDYKTVLGLTTFTGADSVNKDILREGAVGRIRGFDTFEHNRFDKAYSAAFSAEGMAAAFRVLEPAKGVYKSGVVTDEVSGLSLRYYVNYKGSELGYEVIFDIIYGMNIIEPEKFTRIAEAIA